MHHPLDEHALCASQAALAEDAGDISLAESLYAEAAAGWETFGNVPEQAYALLGRGRCCIGLGRPEAVQFLQDARGLFAAMGYRRALAEVDKLLTDAKPAMRAETLGPSTA